MANPDPEITPDEVKAVRPDAIMATGRSDYPNQVNNVLGFPFIFRGALDVRARKINEPMKQAAVQALAELARRGEDVPDAWCVAPTRTSSFDFGPSYIIPKPFDPRVLQFVCPGRGPGGHGRRGWRASRSTSGNTRSGSGSEAPRSRSSSRGPTPSKPCRSKRRSSDSKS